MLKDTQTLDTTVIFLNDAGDGDVLSYYSDSESTTGNAIVGIAVVFNQAPFANAYQSAMQFYNKLSAAGSKPGFAPFPSYTLAQTVGLSDLAQQNATAGMMTSFYLLRHESDKASKASRL